MADAVSKQPVQQESEASTKKDVDSGASGLETKVQTLAISQNNGSNGSKANGSRPDTDGPKSPSHSNPRSPSSQGRGRGRRRPQRSNGRKEMSPSHHAQSPHHASQQYYYQNGPYMYPTMMPPPVFSVDVECVATGPEHNKRAVAQVSVVDQWERVLLNFYVKPKEEVFSYLTALTGLNEQHLAKGVDLETACQTVQQTLPPNCILVGQNILKDIQWLGLEEGKHYGGLQDLSGLWRAFNEKYKSYTYFSLHHEAKVLLGIKQEPPHNAATDAILSVRLYNLYKRLEQSPDEMARAHKLLLEAPIDASFAKQNPTYDGVCMGNKKTCKCGAPFFF